MLADIATGKTAGADVVLLIALIVAGLAVVLYVMARNVAAGAACAALGLVAFALMLW